MVRFKRGVMIEGSKRLSNYGSLDYDSLVKEIAERHVANVRNVFHDDKTPSNQRQ
jgi:hypothetical protein